MAVEDPDPQSHQQQESASPSGRSPTASQGRNQQAWAQGAEHRGTLTSPPGWRFGVRELRREALALLALLLLLVLLISLALSHHPQLAGWTSARVQTLLAPAYCPPPAPDWQQRVPPFEDRDLGACGNWQADYAQLHADILAGRAPPRYVVAGGIAGIADNLGGAVTAFLHALLTDRAFQMRMEFAEPRWEWGYQPRGVNWTVPLPDTYPLAIGRDGHDEWPAYDDINSVAYFQTMVIGDKRPYDERQDEDTKPKENPVLPLLANGSFLELAAGYRTIYFEAGSGKTHLMFENKFIAEKLYRMGLRPDTAFGCVVRFLMEPTAAVKKLFAEEAALLSDEDALKVGVQIRVGDKAIFGDDPAKDKDIAYFKAYFGCAEQVWRTRMTHPEQRVIVYLISDSNHTRQLAKAAYPDKVFANTKHQIGHILGNLPEYGDLHQSQHAAVMALMTSVGENWAFGLTDIQVTTWESGFGKSGALRSLVPHAQYMISNFEPRKCSVAGYDTYDDLAKSWSQL